MRGSDNGITGRSTINDDKLYLEHNAIQMLPPATFWCSPAVGF